MDKYIYRDQDGHAAEHRDLYEDSDRNTHAGLQRHVYSYAHAEPERIVYPDSYRHEDFYADFYRDLQQDSHVNKYSHRYRNLDRNPDCHKDGFPDIYNDSQPHGYTDIYPDIYSDIYTECDSLGDSYIYQYKFTDLHHNPDSFNHADNNAFMDRHAAHVDHYADCHRDRYRFSYAHADINAHEHGNVY
jgi:hypothetical protein